MRLAISLSVRIQSFLIHICLPHVSCMISFQDFFLRHGATSVVNWRKTGAICQHTSSIKSLSICKSTWHQPYVPLRSKPLPHLALRPYDHGCPYNCTCISPRRRTAQGCLKPNRPSRCTQSWIFLADGTITHAFGTLCHLCVCQSVVCRLWRFVL